MELSYRTAGESHGPCMLAVVEGMPAGVQVDTALIDAELARRQGGYGRGARQRIEHDSVEILSGVRLGRTIGSPVALRIANNVMHDVFLRPEPNARTGVQYEDWYLAEFKQGAGPGNARTQLGRGLKSVWWGLEIRNIDGGDFRTRTIQWRPLVLDRRI